MIDLHMLLHLIVFLLSDVFIQKSDNILKNNRLTYECGFTSAVDFMIKETYLNLDHTLDIKDFVSKFLITFYI